MARRKAAESSKAKRSRSREPFGVQFPYHVFAGTSPVDHLRTMLEPLLPEIRANIINSTDSHGHTLLHVAGIRGRADTARFLVESGADITRQTDDDPGFTALILSVLKKHPDVVDCLLQLGADPNQRNNWGFGPLHEASRLGLLGIVKALLSHGADIELEGSDDSTPLCWAVLENHIAVARLLLECGANPDHAGISFTFPGLSGFRMTPLHSASCSEKTEMARLLLSHGADPNHPKAVGPGGHTCLHEAARTGKLALAEDLLAHGIDASARASDGTAATDWARMMHHPRLLKLLEKHCGG